jgi:hypothetical protein
MKYSPGINLAEVIIFITIFLCHFLVSGASERAEGIRSGLHRQFVW